MQQRNKPNKLENSLFYIPHQSRDLNRDYDSGASVREVPSSHLPHGVLGFYDPVTHSIYVASDISEKDKIYVKKHESGHALGYRDEAQTDAYAFSQTGYNPFPFRKAA